MLSIRIASESNGLGLATGVTKAAVSTAVFISPKFRPNVKSTVSGEPARSDRLNTIAVIERIVHVQLDRRRHGRQEGARVLVAVHEVTDADVVVDQRDVVGVDREGEPTESLEVPVIIVVDIAETGLKVGGIEREEIGCAGKSAGAGLGRDGAARGDQAAGPHVLRQDVLGEDRQVAQARSRSAC